MNTLAESMLSEEIINGFAKEVYEQNVAVGWWDKPRTPFTCFQLISSEFAEATEGERKNLMDDHLPHRKAGEVELADAYIRTVDFGHSQGFTFTNFGFEKDLKDSFELLGHPADCHFFLNVKLVDFARDMNGVNYSILVAAILKAAEFLGYDIQTAADEKFDYNKHRPDHKRENRESEHGKKF